MTIDVRARVVTSQKPYPEDDRWEAVASPAYVEAAGEFLMPTGTEPPRGAMLAEPPRSPAPARRWPRCCCSASSSRTASSTSPGRPTSARRSRTAGRRLDSVEVDTHAWVEALLRSSGGRGEPVWVGADPTNRILVTESHVKIGHGRFYADVPPIKGVYRGAADAELDASVSMTRLDPATRA